MRYVISNINEHDEEMAFRLYMTDSIYYMADNKRLSKRFADLLDAPPPDLRSGDEIAMDVIGRLNLRLQDESI